MAIEGSSVVAHTAVRCRWCQYRCWRAPTGIGRVAPIRAPVCAPHPFGRARDARRVSPAGRPISLARQVRAPV